MWLPDLGVEVLFEWTYCDVSCGLGEVGLVGWWCSRCSHDPLVYSLSGSVSIGRVWVFGGKKV